MLSRLRRIKDDLKTGWALVRKGSAEAVDRSLEEIEILRLRRQLYAMEDQVKELFRAAGERAVQLIERGAESVMNDKELARLFEQVDQLKQEEARIRFEMDQIRE